VLTVSPGQEADAIVRNCWAKFGNQKIYAQGRVVNWGVAENVKYGINVSGPMMFPAQKLMSPTRLLPYHDLLVNNTTGKEKLLIAA
jgi:hypothetical protein